MLHKLLPEYPEDAVHRSSYYQYRKPIDLYVPTPNEVKLLNIINAHHSHWVYSRQPLTSSDELVRVSDFLPFYEHLRSAHTSTHIPRTSSVGSSRQILHSVQQPIERPLGLVEHTPNGVRRPSSLSHVPTPIQRSFSSASDLSRDRALSLSRPVPLAPVALRSSRLSKRNTPACHSSQCPSTPLQQLLATTSSSGAVNSINTGKKSVL